MKKKILSIFTILTMIIVLTACSNSENNQKEPNDKDNDTSDVIEEENYSFTESVGKIKYMEVKGEKVPFPKTLGEYYYFLEQAAEKVEFGDIGSIKKLDDEMSPGGLSSMMAYLKVYFDDSDSYAWFGVNYSNTTDKKIMAKDATIQKIILMNDETEEESKHIINDLEFFCEDDKSFVMNGKTTLKNVMKILGQPNQVTDGNYYFNDPSGIIYTCFGSTAKGYLTKVEIDLSAINN